MPRPIRMRCHCAAAAFRFFGGPSVLPADVESEPRRGREQSDLTAAVSGSSFSTNFVCWLLFLVDGMVDRRVASGGLERSWGIRGGPRVSNSNKFVHLGIF